MPELTYSKIPISSINTTRWRARALIGKMFLPYNLKYPNNYVNRTEPNQMEYNI